MKLRKRIAAAFTALALMCTFTDPAALGGVFDAVGTAFAITIETLSIDNQFPMPRPGTIDTIISDDCFNVGQSGWVDNDRKDVKWYQGVPSYGGDGAVILPGENVSTFGYNKPYFAVVKYSPSTNNQASTTKSITLAYKLSETKENEYYAHTWLEGSLICAVIDFSQYPTVKPKTLSSDSGVVFSANDVGYDSSKKNEVFLLRDNYHSLESHIDPATIVEKHLPKNATILTEDPDIYFTAPVVWTTRDGFTYVSKQTYDVNAVEAMQFRIKGTVSVSDITDKSYTEKLNSDSFNNVFEVYATIDIDAASATLSPTFATAPGTYNNDIAVKINPTGEDGVTYYYYVGSDLEEVKNKSPEEFMGEKNEYQSNRGILLSAGDKINKKLVFYVRVIAYHPKKNIGESLIGEFILYVKSSTASNIPEVHIKVSDPVGGSALGTTAELDKNNPTYEDEVLQISSFGSVSWSEPNQSNSAIAAYNTRYTMSVEVVPASPTFAFMRTPDVYVNGMRASGVNTGNGNFTITYTFPLTYKLTDYATVSPGKVANVPSGTTVTEMESSYLPKTVKVVGTKDNRISEDCAVTWDLTSAVNEAGEAYSPKIGKAQTVTITGKVKLPDYMQEDASKTSVTARIYVEDASKVPVPWAKPEDTIEGEGTTVFNSPQEITLATSVNSAMIYYTIEAFENLSDIKLADPTEAGGTKYLEPILLSGEPGKSLYYCIKAIAIAPGMRQSDVATFIYKVVIERKKAEIPTANPLPGNYDHSLKVKLNTETPNGKIYYTLDPNASKGKFVEYTGAIAMDVETNSSKTFKLRCYTKAPDDSLKDSDISEVMVYNITVPMEKAKVPVPDREEGTSEDTIKIKLTCETAKADIYYSLDRPIIRGQYEGKKYKTGSSITLKRVDNEVVVYKLYTYAKSTDPDNLADSDIKVYYYTVGKDYGVKMIEVAKRPSKYSYYMGEKLNVTGGLIKVTYEDTSKQSETIYMTESMIQDFDSWVLGQQTLTVYYMGCTTAFNIIVRKRSSSSGTDNPKPPADDDKKDDSKTDDTKDDTTDDNTDNSDDTVSDPTMQGSQVKGWTQLQKKIASAAKNSRVVIYLNGNTSVPADIINTARKKNITLEFVINDMLSWVIDTGALKKNVASVSVGVKSKDVYIPSVLIDGAGEKEIVRMHTYGANKIGAVLYVKTGSKVNNRFANLYVYNGDSHQLEFRDTSKVVASSGLAQVVPVEGGDYVLMLDTSTRLPGDADNSTTIDARDASAILKMCVGMMEFDDSCDYNQDGFVNALDSASILRSVVGLSK